MLSGDAPNTKKTKKKGLIQIIQKKSSFTELIMCAVKTVSTRSWFQILARASLHRVCTFSLSICSFSAATHSPKILVNRPVYFCFCGCVNQSFCVYPVMNTDCRDLQMNKEGIRKMDKWDFFFIYMLVLHTKFLISGETN